MAFSPSDAAFEGFRLTRERPGAILAWSGFYLLALMLIFAVAALIVGPTVVASMGNPPQGDPEALAAWFAPLAGALAVLVPGMIIISAMLAAVVYRAVLRPQDSRMAYLRLGGDELRLFLVSFLLVLLWTLAIAIPVVVLTVVLTLMGDNPATALVGVIGGVALFCLLIWGAVRLSLSPVMTFAEGKIRIFESWGLTKGRFWGLLGMYLLAFVFVNLLGSLVANVALALSGGPQLIQGLEAGVMPDVTPALVVGGLIYLVLTAILAIMQMVIANAPQAVAYRELKGLGAADVF
jgi:hypothetical protein